MLRVKKNILYIFIVYFLLCTAVVFSEEKETIPIPEDPKDMWTVGITEFSGSNISDENLYLLSSLPALIEEQIISIPNHLLSKDEINNYQKWIVYNEIKKIIDELNNLQKKQDEELFLNKKEYERKKIIDGYEKERIKLRKKISLLRQIEVKKIEVSKTKDLSLKGGDGKLLPSPPYSPLQYTLKNDIDILITGSVEEIQGYLYLEIQIFHRILEKSIFTYNDAGTREELSLFIEDALPEIITNVLGREWAGLLIDVDPAFCYIKIKNELVGMGTMEQQYLLPGDITIDIIAPGYKSLQKTVTLTARKMNKIDIRLEKSESTVILVESLPQGADVYLNSMWIGKAPIIIERPEKVSRLLFVLPGFNSATFRMGPTTDGNVLIPLISLKVDWKSIKDNKRGRFFGSLAGFILSLPVPVFSFGLARDAWIADRRNDYELYSSVYYWSVFVTGALFVNMLYELYRYVKSADRPAG